MEDNDAADDTDKRLSDYSITNILENASQDASLNETETGVPTAIMPSFIIKYKLKLPPAPSKVRCNSHLLSIPKFCVIQKNNIL